MMCVIQRQDYSSRKLCNNLQCCRKKQGAKEARPRSGLRKDGAMPWAGRTGNVAMLSRERGTRLRGLSVFYLDFKRIKTYYVVLPKALIRPIRVHWSYFL